ncbi:MAG TPA: N-acetyl-gamma-glutamyl-phosphate reductase [Phycisphaerales bacterium]|nr:N-acetyl-gamma-glutamyl-phosphate reductase [Phycisphaerales bacterium]HMP37250.1 N-acetyl-gamma-glutamyl-phosphate reductase [Phycisphaerales bacterium]
MTERLRCAIVGAGGYGGIELVRILLGHAAAAPTALFGSARTASEAPRSFAALAPRLAGQVDLAILPATPEAILAAKPDVVFLATPNEVSHDLAPPLVDAGVVTIDLSGAFRLPNPASYPAHYGFEHRRPDLLGAAIYGLAEHARPELRTATLIANPGCYPTAAIVALRPLVEAAALAPARRPIIDAISGVSGAGRSAELRSHFCEVSVQPYGVLRHRHTPEIDHHSGVPTVFTPHLGPYDRGILATIHATLRAGMDDSDVRRIFEKAYGSEPFVRLLAAGTWPSVAAVRGTNHVDLAYAVDSTDGHLIVCAAIDNLVKGAAGQAVQCMNIRFGLDERAGLLPHGGLAPA